MTRDRPLPLSCVVTNGWWVQVAYLEKLRTEHRIKSAIHVQARYRGWLSHREYKRKVKAAITLQAHYRGQCDRRFVESKFGYRCCSPNLRDTFQIRQISPRNKSDDYNSESIPSISCSASIHARDASDYVASTIQQGKAWSSNSKQSAARSVCSHDSSCISRPSSTTQF